ncbi:MAG: DUF1549 domain-containing protein [Fuerstia sp.]|nr:DUF1549 domain-containing protein [Fuerstiella sp.]
MRRLLYILVILFLHCSFAVGPSARADEAIEHFVNNVRPLLEAKCVSCHGAEKREGGLRLDSAAAAARGGELGPAVVPGDADGSLLVKAITFLDPDLQMPPKQKLSDKEITILTEWVNSGATWPDSTDGTDHPADDGSVIGDAFTDERNPVRRVFGNERLDLWSLRKPVVAERPTEFSNRHPIDSFVLERLQTAGFEFSPEADRRTLIRRLTLDLTGLPPTPDEVAAFVADTSPGAYETLVDRLLSSLHYGERQARLWLDVVRYADTNGYERDEFRPLAWQYRDYVIRAFNQDKPFDQFIREQLAGDELVDGAPKTPAEADMLIATGYLRLGQWDSTATIFQEEDRLRAEMMSDLTNTTAAAFLGMTMSCCQCHDHKYDPLLQADHYRLRAFFAGVTPRDDLAISLPDEQAEIDKHNAEVEQQITSVKSELDSLDRNQAESAQRVEELTAKIAEFEGAKRSPAVAMAATDSGPTAPAIHVLYQGDFSSLREEVPPGFVSLFTPGPADIHPPRDNTTGRRLALANWIASNDNPWTARVIVNRIWQQHFGIGLVATPNDFGYSGERPSHPELLDWLAVEFMQRGWSVKDLHRLIVTSATYQQSSSGDFSGSELSARRQLYGRQSVRRLDAETLRDSLLAVSGLLKPHDAGKPIWPPIEEELLHAQPAVLEAIEGKDENRMQGWYPDAIEATDVRSVFLVRKRCLPIPFLQAFDLPETIVSCARRDTTVVAPQALMLLNSRDSVRYAQALADRVRGEQTIDFEDAASTRRLVETLFDITLNRKSTADERQLSVEFLQRHQNEHQDAGAEAARLALIDLCRAMLNLNEFAYID